MKCDFYSVYKHKPSFQLDRGIIETNLLTKFHEDRTKNVACRVYRRKTAQPTGGHVFQRTRTNFELNPNIIKTKNLKKVYKHDPVSNSIEFHEDRTRNVASRVFTRKTAPPTGGHTNILTNFELDCVIIGTNLLTKSYEDQTRKVASTVFTRKTAPPTGRHVFQRTGTTF
ncbi:hypothetical protein DPMN_051490 [Dreissena polymorpha]|uniref:Uncharacterized protein n=1 Tax=Dreissena polymorpha TaxID=45954 RepID=A0A9D4CJ31_DREPO|nr:hypothetical protein DPMN_051490 [Dreissena polymorpha]